MSELSENAANVAEVMYKTAGCPVVVFDKDHVVASAGVPKREFAERRVTAQLEELMLARDFIEYKCWYYDVASESGTCDTPRNMPMEKLKAAAESAGIPAAEGTLPDGLQRGIAWAKKRDGILLCAGSLLLSSVVLNELNVPV